MGIMGKTWLMAHVSMADRNTAARAHKGRSHISEPNDFGLRRRARDAWTRRGHSRCGHAGTATLAD